MRQWERPYSADKPAAGHERPVRLLLVTIAKSLRPPVLRGRGARPLCAVGWVSGAGEPRAWLAKWPRPRFGHDQPQRVWESWLLPEEQGVRLRKFVRDSDPAKSELGPIAENAAGV